jgi:predicted dehydrogenase/threonine dehydrogenase-like Zn-dependent dehydrogenase
MKQVVQPVGGGPVEVLDVPRPAIGPTEVLVRTVASVISPGTERAVTALAQSSLLAKARARPDLVRQVVRKARAEGLAATAQAVRSRLATDVPLGYSAAGVALEVGVAVDGIAPGQLVATGGAGLASHAEFQAVPGLLCAVVPEAVPAQDAAFATLASIPLHALRLAGVGPGSKVAVLGLGLIGQLAARLAMASGCDVAGIDPGGFARDTAARSGVLALDEAGDATTEAILRWSRGRGADAVLVCAADSSAGPMSRAPALCRDRACVVMVGDVGMPPQRTPFYEREISLLFARSYGPGRYEPSYELWGVDYPAGQVRWTEGRNQEAVLDLLAAGRLQVADLVTQSFGIEGADAAYRLLEERTEPCLAIRLSYPAGAAADEPVRLRPRSDAVTAARTGEPGVGWIGAGAFSTGTLLPAFRQAGFTRFVAVATASGVSARRVAERHGFEQAVSGAAAVIGDPDISVVVIATPHDTHEELACQALAAGRDVWCEKPLALSLAGLDEVEKAWRGSGRQLTLGFNRRWAPAVLAARRALAEEQGPRLVAYRIAAGRVPDGHWYLDRRQGGRMLGEVCHFVDLAQALVDAGIRDATAVLGGDPALGCDGAAVVLRFADGSVASITYGSTPPVAGKEHIEVLAGSRQVIIDDFRSVQVNGKTGWHGRPDKGHRAHAAAFRQAVAGSGEMPTEAMLSTMRATIQAASQALAP